MGKYTHVVEEQLCIDYDCTIEELRSPENIIRGRKHTRLSRPVGKESALKICVYREKLLIMADERLVGWCKQELKDMRGTWLSEPENLLRIHQKLQEFGQRLADTHHHYIPCDNRVEQAERYPLKWFEQDEMEVFRGDSRFWEALLFDEEIPDMLAVCAMDGDTILGMASATRNCPKLWEIGVNVTPEGRGKGIGTYVTTALKEELLKRGIVPTYATVESHIKSQRVAFQSGFIPVFYELFSE